MFEFSFFFPHVSHAQSDIEQIRDYKTDIEVHTDATLHLTETIVYDFGAIEHHGIFREIPVSYKARGGNYKLYLSHVSITDAQGHKLHYETSRGSGNVTYKIGDPDVLISGVHTYVISYDVANGINFFDDHDELYWNAVGTGWDVPIAQATAHVSGPGNSGDITTTCYTGHNGSTEQNCTIIKDTGGVTYSAANLNQYEGLTIVAGFPKGTITEPTAWQKALARARDNWIVILPFVVLITMYLIWRKYGKDPKGSGIVTAQYEAPDNLSPMEISVIAKQQISNTAIPAEIIYLATHGYLKINRTEKKKLGLFNSHDYELTKLKNPGDDLTEAEKTLLDGLFEDGDFTSMNDLKGKHTLGKAISAASKQTYTSLVKKGYFPRNPNTLKAVFLAIAFLVGIWGSGFLGGLFGVYGVVSGIVSAIIIALFGIAMPMRTPKGVATRDLVLGLKEYMNVAEKDRLAFHNAPEKNPQLFEKLLPFAIALGVDKAWSKQFEGIYTGNPSWYSDASHGAFNAAVFSSSIGDFSSAVSSASSTASSGGSGFSGGGGGGFGGGGGGSW